VQPDYTEARLPAEQKWYATFAERLRSVGNSSGDEIGSRAMKHWEIIADNLHKDGWSWGYVSAVDPLKNAQSGLLTHSATLESVSSSAPMKY
jgi:hypothetical protein